MEDSNSTPLLDRLNNPIEIGDTVIHASSNKSLHVATVVKITKKSLILHGRTYRKRVVARVYSDVDILVINDLKNGNTRHSN